MGFAADAEAEFGSMWGTIETGFTIIYFMEMCIKIYALRKEYFQDNWNKLDFWLVWFAIVDSWIITPLGIRSDVLGMLRALRLCRLARLIRESKRLWNVLCGIFKAFKAMFWLGVLLGLMLYISGILCVIGIGKAGKDLYPAYNTDPESWSEVEEFNSYQYFGTLGRSIFTLFSIAILAEWPGIAWPVFEAQPEMIVFFVVFIVVMTFGIMNAFIGIIVDAVSASIGEWNLAKQAAERERKIEMLCKIKRNVFQLDSDRSGTLSLEELATGLDVVHEDLDLPASFGAQRVLDMLDLDGNGEITCDTFEKVFADIIDPKPFHKFCMIIAGIHGNKKEIKDLHHKIDTLVDGMHAMGMQLKCGASGAQISSQSVDAQNKGCTSPLDCNESTTTTASTSDQVVSSENYLHDAKQEKPDFDVELGGVLPVGSTGHEQDRIAELEAQLAEKDLLLKQVIGHLQTSLAEKDKDMKGLQTRLSEKDALIRHLDHASSCQVALRSVDRGRVSELGATTKISMDPGPFIPGTNYNNSGALRSAAASEKNRAVRSSIEI
jgi:voltage-gated sodium channel